MRKIILGTTGLEVTELCFGALPMGPLQKNLSINECTKIVSAALLGGINFVDTAQAYKTYLPIAKAIKEAGIRPIIASKSAASTYEDMEKAILEALRDLDIDYIDIFHLHAARATTDVFEVRKGALDCLLDYKKKSKIKAIGISTHSAAVTALSAENPDIDVIYPIINMAGMGILEGRKEDMLVAIQKCLDFGKGVYLMKVLAGGNLVKDYYPSMEFARSISDKTSISLGMVSLQEVDFNLKYFNNEDLSSYPTPGKDQLIKRFYPVPALCCGCSACIRICPNHAISIQDKKAAIQYAHCISCGYCVGVCKEFAIRMI